MIRKESRAHIQTALKIVVAATSALLPLQAFGHEVIPTTTKSVPCAVLRDFDGEVESLDASRTQLVTVQQGASIECGGWISVKSGWAQVQHRDGFKIHAGQDTFFQVSDPQAGDNPDHDHVLLYKGQIAAFAGNGSPELSVITANGRARIKDGQSIIVFNQDKVETQLIVLETVATLQNRFVSNTVMKVRAGEASQLNFNSNRVVPEAPRAISMASLKQKFVDLRFGDKERAIAVKFADQRAERTLASKLASDGKKSGHVKAVKKSKKSKTPAVEGHYDQTAKLSKREKAALDRRWLERLAGDSKSAKKILYPKRSIASTKSKASKKKSKAKGKAKQNSASADPEHAEKEKVLEELGQIKAE